MLLPLEILNGSLSVILSLIAIYSNSLILSKYFELKEKTLLFVGISGIFMFSSWWSSSISFLLVLVYGEGLSLESYLIIGNIFLPIAIICWLAAFTELLYKSKKKLILSVFVIVGVLFEGILFYFTFTNPSTIGQLQGVVDIQYTSLLMGFLFLFIIVTLVTGVLFSIETRKSKSPEIKLKGKLILAGFLCYTTGAILDSAIPLNPITLPITRIILMSSSIFIYGGFNLPNWMKNLLLK